MATLTDLSPLADLSAVGLADAGQALRGGGRLDRQALERRSVEFEAVYLAQMLQPMFADLQAEEPFGGGFGEEVWRSLQLQEYGRAIASAGGVGIGDAVARELLRAQEAGGGAGLGDAGPSPARLSR